MIMFIVVVVIIIIIIIMIIMVKPFRNDAGVHLIEIMNSELIIIANWFKANRLSLNLEKTTS